MSSIISIFRWRYQHNLHSYSYDLEDCVLLPYLKSQDSHIRCVCTHTDDVPFLDQFIPIWIHSLLFCWFVLFIFLNGFILERSFRSSETTGNDCMVFMLDKASFSRMYFLDKLSHGVPRSIDYIQIKQARSWTMVCQEIRRFTCDDIMVAYLFVSFTESVMFDMRFDSKANNSACFFLYSVRTKYFDRRWQEFNVSIWFFSAPKLSMFVALC